MAEPEPAPERLGQGFGNAAAMVLGLVALGAYFVVCLGDCSVTRELVAGPMLSLANIVLLVVGIPIALAVIVVPFLLYFWK